LVVFSSTNANSYKQTSRRSGASFLLYPSTTEDEYYHYATLFDTDLNYAQKIAGITGTGRVRYLRMTEMNVNVTVKAALSKFDINQFFSYTSVDEVHNTENSPSILFDADLPSEINCVVTPKIDLLKTRYAFANTVWRFSSKFISSFVCESKFNNSEKMVLDFFNTIGEKNMAKLFGTMKGLMLEHFAPKHIAENGLICQSNSTDVVRKNFLISKGLTLKKQSFENTDDILIQCTDPKILYDFGSSVHGFDSFNPPNNFFQQASSQSGKHCYLLSAVLKCCDHLSKKNLPVNFIIVVREDDVDNWKGSIQSYKVNIKSVVDQINQQEEAEKKEKKMQLKKTDTIKEFKWNGQRRIEKLPEDIQEKLRKYHHHYLGLITRKFSTDVRVSTSFVSSTTEILCFTAWGSKMIVVLTLVGIVYG
jgi:hypothetical protein